MEIRDKINELLIEVLKERNIKYSKIEITENTKLFDDLGIDSIGLAVLTVLIEDEFSIDIFEDGIVRTVGEIYRKIEPYDIRSNQ